MRCFLHADDCGLTRGITESILACLDAGALASTSVMMGGAYAKEALAALGQRPSAAAGVHLNLLEGAPVSPAASLPELAGKDGLFRHGLMSLAAMIRTLNKRRKQRLLSEARTEFSAQIDLFRGLLPGVPLRLDGHLHIHALPELRGVVRELLREYPVTYVRVPYEPYHSSPAPLLLQVAGGLRRGLLAFWSSGLREMLDETGVPHNRFLAGAFASGSLTLPRLRASLEAINRTATPDDCVEIMVHPGGLAPGEEAPHLKSAYRNFYLSEGRNTERALLLSPELRELLGGSLVAPAACCRAEAV